MIDVKNEGYYMVAMKIAQEMLSKGLITIKEYREFDKKMKAKYTPKISDFMLAITDR